MIELTEKTQQDFLNREWVQKLLDTGVDMSDAKYCLYDDTRGSFISLYDKEWGPIFKQEHCIIPTYTVSELLYKLHEWIFPTIDRKEYSAGLKGGLKFIKDAPFYIFWYEDKEGNILSESLYEYPIESLASLLIWCHQNHAGYETENGQPIDDTGDISNK